MDDMHTAPQKSVHRGGARDDHGHGEVEVPPKQQRLRQLALLLCILIAGVDLGGSFYEHFLVFPVWSAAPPQSFWLIQSQRGGMSLVHFWVPVHIALTLALLVSLGLHWKLPRQRWLIVLALVAYVAMRAWTFAYFIPEVSAFMQMPPDHDPAGLAERAAAWGRLSHGRTLLVLLTSGFLLAAALPPKARARRE